MPTQRAVDSVRAESLDLVHVRIGRVKPSCSGLRHTCDPTPHWHGEQASIDSYIALVAHNSVTKYFYKGLYVHSSFEVTSSLGLRT